MRDVKEPEVRKAEIMDAAIRLFTRKGYLNTTTQDIIDEVNISRGLLYYHFKNKEDILYCIIERYSQPLLKGWSIWPMRKRRGRKKSSVCLWSLPL